MGLLGIITGLNNTTPCSDVSGSYVWPLKEVVLLWNTFLGNENQFFVPENLKTGSKLSISPQPALELLKMYKYEYFTAMY